jgi:hypothetical protein
MPFNGSGTFTVVNTYVPNTTILSAAVNQNFTDIATGLSDCLTRDGQAGMTAVLSMGNNKITNVAEPTLSTDGATKNYVDTTLTAIVWSTGDVKLTYKQVADSGWVLFTDGTIGDASSGATVALATTSALFTLLYNSPFTDANCPVFTSTGTPTTRVALGTAAAAYAAHARLSTPKALGRAMAIAGAGSGLTTRVLGSAVGSETATLLNANLPAYTPGGTITSGTTTGSDIVKSAAALIAVQSGAGAIGLQSGFGSVGNDAVSATFVGTAQGGTSTPVAIMDPTAYLNAMVKL